MQVFGFDISMHQFFSLDRTEVSFSSHNSYTAKKTSLLTRLAISITQMSTSFTFFGANIPGIN